LLVEKGIFSKEQFFQMVKVVDRKMKKNRQPLEFKKEELSITSGIETDLNSIK